MIHTPCLVLAWTFISLTCHVLTTLMGLISYICIDVHLVFLWQSRVLCWLYFWLPGSAAYRGANFNKVELELELELGTAGVYIHKEKWKRYAYMYVAF